ncbi:flagellar export protein FliJ [Ethanoligenens harbinense]|uniref:Flagellar FliJ protein n=1 Tax=Ethanoligenens harbinense (strain DSM 18485 / JCM 12961 / CGMCC 1.5033 / YUAN-3) TaxID=663278 RepID=E6U6J7_ETHHY|nr:hypothetical protein [Ethanoligenens harbinense]ADU28067.1 hypothetical protein Ethha_2574 [Ethanoligenens harbinense YUAN-3]AVQ97082.1 hypothetical protein CXQ68_13220 [Ethanoligenens harbinense YUAN-3]AYF39744.1 hypothetical protein CXP51_13120 [Ethanoligenens harbinense]AYF42577.1 hypothetical protein CN246_13700 [Ethanoligenens harbinense]QCN93325.1 hypothetical protein DRA42_13270 [Ethanoligenens harbinense]
MQRFKFRLAPVRNLRQYAEREQKDVLAREQHALRLLEQEAEALREAERQWSARYLRVCGAGAVPAEMMRIQSYLAELRARRKDNAARIREQTETVEQARELLMTKMQARKTIDALYEKQIRLYHREQKIQTEKEIEEQIAARLHW